MCLPVSCMGCSCIILLGRGQFVFPLPKGESKASAGHSLSPAGFWVHSQVPLEFGVLLCLWVSVTPEEAPAKSHVQQDMDACASGRSTHYKEKKLFPDCTNFTNQWELQQSQLPTCPISCASCGLPALFLEEKAVAGKQGNLDFVPTLAFQFSPSCPLLPPLLCCVPPRRRTVSCLHRD